jgi:hypothetical protein
MPSAQHLGLSDQVSFYMALAPALRDNTAATGTSFDMSGYSGIAYILILGAIDITVDFAVHDSANDSTFALITGASATQFTATDDNKIAVVEVWRPTERYVRPVVTVGDGATGAYCAVVGAAFARNGNIPPDSQHTTMYSRVKVQDN